MTRTPIFTTSAVAGTFVIVLAFIKFYSNVYDVETEHMSSHSSYYPEHRRNLNSTPLMSRYSSVIDLDISVPTVDELYARLTLLVAFSSNHYNESMGFIGSAQKHMEGKRIIVYDLGMTSQQRRKVSQLCDVEVRSFPFEAYPPHVKDLLTYAFKPILINMVLNEIGVIYYGDASVRFKNSLRELLPGIERHHGYMVNILAFHPKNLTVPEMFEKLGVNRTEYYYSNISAPRIQAGSQLVVNSSTIQTRLMRPWLECALDQECIAPKGSSRKNHRQDASALSLLVYKNLYREWTIEDNDTAKMQSVLKVRRRSDGWIKHPRTCRTD